MKIKERVLTKNQLSSIITLADAICNPSPCLTREVNVNFTNNRSAHPKHVTCMRNLDLYVNGTLCRREFVTYLLLCPELTKLGGLLSNVKIGR